MKKLTQIEGIGASYAQKLQQAGVGTLDRLLENDYITEIFPTIAGASLFWVSILGTDPTKAEL